MNAPANITSKGRLTQIIGAVVDVEFEGVLPAILNARETTNTDPRTREKVRLVFEVAQHQGHDDVPHADYLLKRRVRHDFPGIREVQRIGFPAGLEPPETLLDGFGRLGCGRRLGGYCRHE